MIMEKLDFDLKTLILRHLPCNKYLNLKLIKHILKSILHGVNDMHKHKIIHRDLNSQNILIDKKTMNAKICDFGLSISSPVKLINARNDIGTLSCKAPEMMQNIPYDKNVDIWSVGCIFAFIANKERLFNGDTNQSQLNDIFKTFNIT